MRDALDLSDVVNAVGVALGHAWRGLGAWWRGEAGKGAGKVGGLVGSLVGRKDGESGSSHARSEPMVSPFDDRMALAGPAVPAAVRDTSPGGTRALYGDEALGVNGGEYRSLRDSSWESSPRGSVSRQ